MCLIVEGLGEESDDEVLWMLGPYEEEACCIQGLGQ